MQALAAKRSRTEIALPQPTPENWRHQVSRTIIALNLPHRAVENEEFRRLLALTTKMPNASVPGRTQIRKDTEEMYHHAMDQIGKRLESVPKVALAADVWTSPSNLAFLGVTAYYITEDWRYEEALIGFEPILERKQGSYLASLLMGCLHNSFFDLRRKLLSVTTDGGSENRTMMRELSQLLRQGGVSWNESRGHLPCLAHVIQLVVGEMVRALRIEAPLEGEEEDLGGEVEGRSGQVGVSFAGAIHKVRALGNCTLTCD